MLSASMPSRRSATRSPPAARPIVSSSRLARRTPALSATRSNSASSSRRAGRAGSGRARHWRRAPRPRTRPAPGVDQMHRRGQRHAQRHRQQRHAVAPGDGATRARSGATAATAASARGPHRQPSGAARGRMRAAAAECVTSRQAAPCSRTAQHAEHALGGGRVGLPVGSSARSRRRVHQRAMATRCSCPPDSCNAGRRARVAAAQADGRASTWKAWNTKPSRARRRRARISSRPAPRAVRCSVPASGRSSPAMQFSSWTCPRPIHRAGRRTAALHALVHRAEHRRSPKLARALDVQHGRR